MAKPTTEQMSRELREKNKQAFLEESKVKDVHYHGTTHGSNSQSDAPEKQRLINSGGIKQFKRNESGMTFVSPSPHFAKDYAEYRHVDKNGAVYPVHVQARNPFDYENPQHVAYLASKINPHKLEDLDDHSQLSAALSSGAWNFLEHPEILRAAKAAGHDAMHIKENDVKNLGVFNPNAIKSATGNRGTYNLSNPDITMAEGGTVKKYAMGGPTAPMPTNQMHHSLGHSVGENVDIRSIGVNEAPDMPTKTFVMPPGGEDLPLGKMPGGALPTGGVNFQPGTPGALGQAPQAPQQPGQPSQGAPGQPAPNQPPSNILNMTHQGQAMSAMTPPGQLHPAMQSQGLAKGGQPKNDKPNLAKVFSEVIGHHLGLEPGEHAANSVRAAHSIGEIIGFSEHNGRPKDILGQNEKAHGAKLPDGRGVEIVGVSLSPDGKGPTPGHLAKTHALLQDPHSFAVKLHDEIETAKQQAAHNGNHLGVRLNVMSNIKPQVHKAIINAHPDVSFYDYSHHNADAVAPNHHVTYVSNGHGHADTNWKQMRERLGKGDNVAMSFSHSAHLPKHVHDEATNKMHPVIDGDAHDFRPLDGHGVVVGHRNKRATGTPENAHEESHGFFTHHDPDIHGSISVVKRHAFDKV